ncbi:hypothetical protein [Phormidium yuhuli]|nr:hypothetical protein [Phormidium yuhuli]
MTQHDLASDAVLSTLLLYLPLSSLASLSRHNVPAKHLSAMTG